MGRHDRYTELADLLQSLVTAQKLEDLSIVARAFPLTGPAEPGTGYRQCVLRFRPSEMPEELTIPPDVEEINIALLGAAPDAGQRQQNVEQVRSSVSGAGADAAWDFRAEFRADCGGDLARYELIVFTV